MCIYVIVDILLSNILSLNNNNIVSFSSLLSVTGLLQDLWSG